MKRRLMSILALLFAFSLCFAACSDDPSGGGDKDTGTQTEEDTGFASDTSGGEDTGAEDTGSEQDSGAEDTGAEDTGSDDDTGGGADTGGDTSADQDAAGGDAGADTGTADSGGGDAAPQSCSDMGYDSCFSNYDCASDERCENVGPAGGEFQCCTKGDRGTKGYNESCTDGLDCESGVCLEGYCSKECTPGSSDCSGNLSDCNSYLGWCTTPS